MNAADIHLGRALRIAARALHLQHIYLDVVVYAVFLARHKLAAFHDAFGEAQLHIHGLGLHALHDGSENFIFRVHVLVIDLAALSLADALHDHLLGGLRGHAAKVLGRHVDFNDIAQLEIGAHGAGFSQGNLDVGILDLFHNHLARNHLHRLFTGDDHAQIHGRAGALLAAAAEGGLAGLLHGRQKHIFADVAHARQSADRLYDIVLIIIVFIGCAAGHLIYILSGSSERSAFSTSSISIAQRATATSFLRNLRSLSSAQRMVISPRS